MLEKGSEEKGTWSEGGSTNLNKKFERGEKGIWTKRELIGKDDQQSWTRTFKRSVWKDIMIGKMDQEIWSTNLHRKCDQEMRSIFSIWSGPIRSDQMIRSGQNRDQIGQAIRPSSIEFWTKPTKAWSERRINKFDQEIWTSNANKKFDRDDESCYIFWSHRSDQIRSNDEVRSEQRSNRQFDQAR